MAHPSATSPAPAARTVALALTVAALGTVMMVMGVMVVFEWRPRLDLPLRGALVAGVLLCAPAQFLYAVAADLLVPDADPRVSGAFELAPWLIVAATLVGVLL